MKYLKIFEEFTTQFQLDEISKEEYYSIFNNNGLVYIPESEVLEFKSKLSKEYKLLYARGSVKDTVEWFRAEYETEIDYHFTCKRFSIKKLSQGQGVDESCYIMSYNYEEFTSFEAPKSHIETLPDQKRISFQKQSYYRFEESDFNQMCENPQILLDYLEKNLDNTPINESFGDIPDPEPMDANEWDDEVNSVSSFEEVQFNQKEKELFISLSDSINVKNKRNMPEIGGSYLGFQLINGGLNPILTDTTIIRSFTTYKNDDEYYYVVIWERDDNDKLYRCDGYECWEKFLKEIFKGYRELVNKQSKTNESYFDDIPEPELMDLNEWWDEVGNAEEVDLNQKEKELFISLSDTISAKHKIDLDALEIGDSQLSFSMVNGHDGIYPNLRSTTVIRSITSYKNDDEFYYVNVWEGNDIDGETKSYRCDGYECWEKFLKEIFKGYRDLINNKTKTNESMFDYVPEPRSLLDENGDITDELSSEFETREREPFTKSEKSFISKLVNTLNEEYTSIKFYNNNKVSGIWANANINALNATEFRLTMGEMGETTHIVRGVKFTDEYYGVEYENFVDSEDEYIISECDGFKCFEKLLTKIFDKINKDYDYEGNT
jgi:hypothetical protein